MTFPFNTLEQCRMILRLAGWIVPRRERAEWHKEWEGELISAWQVCQSRGIPTGKLRWRCGGAFLDAAWCRCHRRDYRFVGGQMLQTPAFLLMALACGFLAFALASGELPRMRLILLQPPYSNPEAVATISATSVTNSAEWVIPYAWVDVWRRREPALESVAAYSWKADPAQLEIGGRRATIAAEYAEAGLFQVFRVKPLLGRTFEPNDPPDSVVLSYGTWRRFFSGDPDILGKSATIDGRIGRVIGVLPERFWFPSNNVGLWRLTAGRAFSGRTVGVVARLRPGVSERAMRWALERDIANATGKPLWGSSLQIWPVQERIRQPLISYTMALGMTLLIMAMVIWFGRLNLRPQRGGAWAACRWWNFFLAKSLLVLLILLAAVVELTPEPYVFPPEKTTLMVESVSLWIFSIGCVLMLWWSLADQQRRCRVCLRKLALPAHVGRSGSLLLGWAGTELVCPEGHGLLHLTETDVSWLDAAQWTQLDQSWEGLFGERAKTEALG